jgi:hypothetical protein
MGLGDRNRLLPIGPSRVGDVIEGAIGGINFADTTANRQVDPPQRLPIELAKAPHQRHAAAVPQFGDQGLAPGPQQGWIGLGQAGFSGKDPMVAAG